MRNPNGYGSVYKLSGKRRHPWAVRKTVGFRLMPNGQAYPKYEFLGYYATRKEATEALIKANSSFAITNYNSTVGELYNEWSVEHFKKVSASRRKGIENSWRFMSPLFAHLKIKDLRLSQITNLLHDVGAPSTCLTAKMTLSLIYDYAIKKEILLPEAKKIMEYVDLSDIKVKNKIIRQIYEPSEIQLLWQNRENYEAKVLLILLYTGLRCGELLSLKLSDIHLEDRYLDITHAKTAAGIRQVPIHKSIISLFEELISFTTSDKFIELVSTTIYYTRIPALLKKLNIKHTMHDTRHTFITQMTQQANIDARILKQIVGHSSQNVTENVYTHVDIKTKIKAIDKLKYIENFTL